MASPGQNNQSGSEFIERLRARFARAERTGLRDDEGPQRRGLMISLCVLISVVLWFTLSMRHTYTVQLEIPTRVVNMPEDMALSEKPPATVQVQLQGEGIELFGMQFNPPTIDIDAEQDEIDTGALMNTLPEEVAVRGVSPQIFNLQKERRISKKIPVWLQGRIETSAARELLYPPRLEPDSIVVSGARSILDSLTYWPTEPIVEADLRDSLHVRVPLSDTLSGLVNRSNVAVMLTAVARPFTEGIRQFRVDVTGVPSDQRYVSLEPDVVTVRYRVPVALYDAAEQAADFFATVSYNEIREDTTGRVTPTLDYPEDLHLRIVEINPSALRYYERLVDQ
ncbi:MAG TPA: hypothetical protein VKP65_06945 [Rhodothermales bacterium]|nr:hypothetical protein [Rhodothermales bacterium]